MSEAILFPGQGAQFPGMGRDWYEAFPAARAVFDTANEVLGFSLTDACWNNNGDEAADVHRTDVAQPGILATSAAIIAVLRERGLDTKSAPFCAGLSLGEYSALWCAGALSLEDALRLVRLRGEAMQAASAQIQSGMTSLMGADEEQAKALAQVGAEHGICQVANLNAPGQVVLSGELAALDAAEAVARDHGVKRAVRLTVAGGFHSECMRPAADRLAAALAEVEVRAPEVPVVSNVTARAVAGPEEIKKNLTEQICAPVLWERSMRWIVEEQSVERFLEPGPGTVLAGLMRRIARGATVRAAATPGDVETE
ncbi:MAG: ACP S-malonyltransferase [Planctomycetota bacterium]